MTRPERIAALVCVLCLLGAVLVGCSARAAIAAATAQAGEVSHG